MSERKARFSLAHQWLLIAFVAMMPLLLVVAYATGAFFQQMNLQKSVVQDAGKVSDLRATALDQLRQLERHARQYRLLEDPRFLEPYLQKLNEFDDTLEQIDNLSLSYRVPEETADSPGTKLQHPLNSALAELRELRSSLAWEELVELDEDAFSSLLIELSQTRNHLDLSMSRYMRALNAKSEQELEAILWRLSLMGACALPLTLFLMGVGFWQMIRPVRRLSAAIRNLGQGDWYSPIAVPGPRDLQSLGEKLNWMREQLLDADRQKQAFLRHVSHELKTPLSAILEAGSLLSDEVPGRLNSQQQDVVRILVENSQNLQELIQQLLNYNAITYSFSARPEAVDIKRLCEKITRRLDQHSHRHRVKWLIDGDPDRVIADPQLMEMVLSNLLSNAFYYSPDGSPVAIKWGRDGTHIWLSVADSGPGFKQENIERIFEPFAKGEARRPGPVQGSGVGLAIVRESAKNLGGTISVESRPEGGSLFSLRFPEGNQS